MKTRFRLIHREERGRTFYRIEVQTGKRFSLETKDRDAATQIVLAKNQSLRQPVLNLQIAKAYLAGTSRIVLPKKTRRATFGQEWLNAHCVSESPVPPRKTCA
jgi:hypothetical protein